MSVDPALHAKSDLDWSSAILYAGTAAGSVLAPSHWFFGLFQNTPSPRLLHLHESLPHKTCPKLHFLALFQNFSLSELPTFQSSRAYQAANPHHRSPRLTGPSPVPKAEGISPDSPLWIKLFPWGKTITRFVGKLYRPFSLASWPAPQLCAIIRLDNLAGGRDVVRLGW